MFLGGVNFALMFQAGTGNFKPLRHNTAFKWYVCIVFIATAIMAISLSLEGHAENWDDVTIDPLFQAISVMSSTGLTEPDFAKWGSPAL